MDNWDKWSKRINDLRIVPRGLVIGYYILFAQFSFYLATWFMEYDFTSIENQAVALAIAGFPVGILGVMTGVLGQLTNNYFRTGNGKGE